MEQTTLPRERPAPQPKPEIVILPAADLTVPPWNPRRSMDEGPLQDLTAYLEKGGPVPRILVWKGSGQAPWAVISGQRRLEAFKRMGREGVEVEILDITLEEAKILASTSNEGEPVNWLEKFGNWESLLADYPKWGGITELASKLGQDRTQVSRAMNLMKLLTPAARQMIRDSRLSQGAIRARSTNSEGDNPAPKDAWDFTAKVGYGLLGLTSGRSLEEAQALAEKAIPVILSKQMTAAQVGQWVKQANGVTPSTNQGSKAPKAKAVEPPSRQGHQENQANGEASNPASKPEPKDSKPLHLDTFTPSPNAVGAQIGSMIAGKELAKRLHLPAQALTQLFPGFARLFQRVIGLFERLGVKNRVTATILALFLVLFVGSTLIGWSNRLMGWLVNSLVYSRPVVSHPHLPPAPAPAAQSAAQVAVQAPNQQGLHNSASDLVPNSNPAKVSEPALSEPSRSGESNGPKSEVPATSETQKGTGTQGQLGGETKKDLSPGSSSDLSAVALAQAEASAKKEAGAPVKGSAKGEDPLKAIGDGVKDATDAVNKAKEGQSDVDKVKNLFGF